MSLSDKATIDSVSEYVFALNLNASVRVCSPFLTHVFTYNVKILLFQSKRAHLVVGFPTLL